MKCFSVLLTHPYRAQLFADCNRVELIAPRVGSIEPEDSISISRFLRVDDGTRLGAIRSFIANENVDIVVCSSPRDDMAHEDSSLVAELAGTRICCVGLDELNSSVFFDKQLTNRFLETVGSHIPLGINTNSDLHFSPVMAKPRKSWGGKGIEKIDTKKELEAHRSRNFGNYVYQAYLTGIEISAVLVTDGNKFSLSPIVFKGCIRDGYRHALKRLRITPFDGSENVQKELDELAANISKLVTNPCCLEIEGIIHKDRLYLTEINGRLTGVTHLLATIGFNVPEKLLQFANVSHRPHGEYGVTGFAAEIPVSSALSNREKEAISSSSFHKRFFERTDALGHRIRALTWVQDADELAAMIKAFSSLNIIENDVESDFELYSNNRTDVLSEARQQ